MKTDSAMLLVGTRLRSLREWFRQRDGLHFPPLSQKHARKACWLWRDTSSENPGSWAESLCREERFPHAQVLLGFTCLREGILTNKAQIRTPESKPRRDPRSTGQIVIAEKKGPMSAEIWARCKGVGVGHLHQLLSSYDLYSNKWGFKHSQWVQESMGLCIRNALPPSECFQGQQSFSKSTEHLWSTSQPGHYGRNAKKNCSEKKHVSKRA